ncbi:MAG: hypothetical protein LC713_03595 [Actinobacteria bacterium]|nr:hypothetical protein [Actinomycetota bacterium]
MSFLFIWQLTFSAPLSIASGCIGFAMYAAYAFPALDVTWAARTLHIPLPLLGDIDLSMTVTPGTLVAVGTCVVAVILLYRKITIIERLSNLLWLGVMLAIVWIVASGLWHFDPKLAFDFPPGAFTLRPEFFYGLGSALLIAVYDYWGYYNVCFLGGEVREPGGDEHEGEAHLLLKVRTHQQDVDEPHERHQRRQRVEPHAKRSW